MKDKENDLVTVNILDRPVNQDIVQTIDKNILDKINALEADLRRPWCIILNGEAYFALCYLTQKISGGTMSLNLEQYRGLTVILDINSTETVKVLQKPFDELTLGQATTGQSWRKFIRERAAIDSSNEIRNKGINADALRGLCLEYDLEYGNYPDSVYEGFALLEFFLETVVGLKSVDDIAKHPQDRETIITWEGRLKELVKKKGKEEGTK